ncbi:MAG: hypothetical protein H6748_00370 [Spirochaetaceae bacterium]|nr:hypothetical protein [Myxococcales bacterium]MCB9722480.1 hypothetical protein [Spirochaetaceae bacterium]HPG28398.1 hypothetical protein [Myxococcota bacterium]
MRPARLRRSSAALAALALLLAATPSQAGFEGSAAEDVLAKGVDVLIVRPLAALRVAVGAVFMAPAALFAAPSGREGLDGAYEVLLEEPIDYAFVRELGEF